MTRQFRLPPPFFPLDYLRENDFHFYEKEILETRGGRVEVRGQGEMIMLSSYSYLGLLNHPRIQAAAGKAIKEYGTGAHGARLLAGTLPIHHEMERALAQWKDTESAVVLTSGYVTNIAAISALLGRHDIVLCDKLNHASIVDGCLLSGAQFKRFQHNDVADLRRQLAEAPDDKNILVVVDAVFSMDGDIIDLPAVSNACREYGALLMVDEAHSLGVLGETGRGIEEHFGLPSDAVDVKMGTLSKTIPSIGGYVAARREITDLIKYRGRAYIFSSALPAPCAAAALEALAVIRDEPWRVAKLRDNTAYFLERLKTNGLDTMQSATAVVPVLVADSDRAFRVAQHCQRRGVFVQCIAQPAVPKGFERLRCIVLADHTKEDLDTCVEIISAAMREHALPPP